MMKKFTKKFKKIYLNIIITHNYNIINICKKLCMIFLNLQGEFYKKRRVF